jgi:hypothetical protein
MSLRSVSLGAVIFLPLYCAQAGPPGQQPDVAAELRAYYQDARKEPGWRTAFTRLAGADAADAERAGTYLCALLAQALKDERSGVAAWRPTPFWGSSGENPAIILRETIAEQLGDGKFSAAVLPVVRWYLEAEPLARLHVKATAALDRLEGKEADDLRAELATRPHPNSSVAIAALQQIGNRKEQLPADRLAALCQHHRAGNRDTARKLNRQQGGPEPPPFDAVKALHSPPVRKLVEDITALVEGPAPAGAEFVVVTQTTFQKGGANENKHETRGWVLKREGDTIELLSPFGWRDRFTKQPKPVAMPAAAAWFQTCTIEPVKIADEVERVEALRKKNDPEHALSEQGGLTGQFEGQAAGLYEVLLAQWLAASKQDDLAARILLPALDTLYEDEHLVRMTRSRLGVAYGYQMFVAFVGDRDYARAERWAQLLSKRFPETPFHHYAVQLAEQLPKRRDDFVNLKLPTPKEWADLKRTLSRDEQIDYLCQRMRLLNCYQWGQPGGLDYYGKQYAEPCGLSRNASWGGGSGKTEVINPLLELAGGQDMQGRSYPGLGLKAADVPKLEKYRREDWFILAVSFWRDFHYGRTLETTQSLFAGIIAKVHKQQGPGMAGATLAVDEGFVLAW